MTKHRIIIEWDEDEHMDQRKVHSQIRDVIERIQKWFKQPTRLVSHRSVTVTVDEAVVWQQQWGEWK